MIVLCKTQHVIRGIGLTSWVRSDNTSSLWTQSTAKLPTPQEQQQQLVRNTYIYKHIQNFTFQYNLHVHLHVFSWRQSAPKAITMTIIFKKLLRKMELTSVIRPAAFSEAKATFILFPAFCYVHSEWSVTQKLLYQGENLFRSHHKGCQRVWDLCLSSISQINCKCTYCTIVRKSFLEWLHLIELYVTKSCKKQISS